MYVAISPPHARMTVFSAVISQIPFLLLSHAFEANALLDVAVGLTSGIALLTSSSDKLIARIAFFSAFTCIIPLVVGARRYKKLDPGAKLLTINLLIVLCAEILSYILLLGYETFEISTQIVYSIYTPVEFILFILMFRYWHDGKTVRNLLTASIPVFLLLWVVGQIWLAYEGKSMEGQVALADVLLPVESLILIIVAIGTLVKIIRDETTPVVSSAVFWITAAILFYFTGNLFVFTFQSIILKDSFWKQAWYLHSTMNFVKYGMFAVGLYIAGRSVKQNPSLHSS